MDSILKMVYVFLSVIPSPQFPHPYHCQQTSRQRTTVIAAAKVMKAVVHTVNQVVIVKLDMWILDLEVRMVSEL